MLCIFCILLFFFIQSRILVYCLFLFFSLSLLSNLLFVCVWVDAVVVVIAVAISRTRCYLTVWQCILVFLSLFLSFGRSMSLRAMLSTLHHSVECIPNRLNVSKELVSVLWYGGEEKRKREEYRSLCFPFDSIQSVSSILCVSLFFTKFACTFFCSFGIFFFFVSNVIMYYLHFHGFIVFLPYLYHLNHLYVCVCVMLLLLFSIVTSIRLALLMSSCINCDQCSIHFYHCFVFCFFTFFCTFFLLKS